MKNVVIRSLSGIVYIALIVGAIWAGLPWFLCLTTAFAVIGVLELATLKPDKAEGEAEIEDIPEAPAPLFRWLGAVIDILATLTLCVLPFTLDFFNLGFREFEMTLAFWVIGIPAYFVVRVVVSLYDKTGNPLERVARSMLSVIYLSLPLLCLTWLYLDNKWLVLLTFIMIWLNDTGAFCFGSTLGKHKLFPRLSPKKSWEGFYGGMLCCAVFGLACYLWIDITRWNVAEWIAYGIVVCVFSTWGDLFESMIKRSCGAKDSGKLIPGHGGILDRIDSLLLVSPAVLIFYQLANWL